MNRLIKNMSEGVFNDDASYFIWMLPFSTLMLVLMILFSALYSYSYLNSLEYEQAISSMSLDQEEKSSRMKEIVLAQSMKKFLDDMNMQGIAQVYISAHEIKLKLSSPVIFESGSAEIKPDIMPLLIELYWHIKDMDNPIIVAGHTDDVPIHGPIYFSNWELSAARAFSVMNFFITRGLEPARFVAHGFGEHKPFFSNDSELGRAMNRRIEISILRGGHE